MAEVSLPWALNHAGEPVHLVVDVAALTEEGFSEVLGDAIAREADIRRIPWDPRLVDDALRTIQILPGTINHAS